MFVPHSVAMRRRGFEPDPEAGFMKNRWVEIGHKKADIALIRKKKDNELRIHAMNRHADKIITILGKFTKIAAINFRLNKMMAKFRQHRIAPKPRFAYGEETWGDTLEVDEAHSAALRADYVARMAVITEEHRIITEKRLAEEKRIEDEKRAAEEKRLAYEARLLAMSETELNDYNARAI